jgi:hypothetical protein
MNIEGYFPGVKRAGREAAPSHPPGSEVINAWSYTCTPTYVFMASYLVKHRGTFTFTFTSSFTVTASTTQTAVR